MTAIASTDSIIHLHLFIVLIFTTPASSDGFLNHTTADQTAIGNVIPRYVIISPQYLKRYDITPYRMLNTIISICASTFPFAARISEDTPTSAAVSIRRSNSGAAALFAAGPVLAALFRITLSARIS